jgi:hypothetical protein
MWGGGEFVCDLRQVGGFPVSSTNKTDRHDINIVESGITHYNCNPLNSF